MDWTTRHFNKIAKVIREKREKVRQERRLATKVAQIQLLNELTLEFAEYFGEKSDHFDADKFIEACGFRQ